MNNTINATVANCTAIPISPVNSVSKEQTVQQVMNDTAEIIQQTMNNFSDEIIAETTETTNEKKAKNYLNSFKEYITTDEFKNQVEKTAKKTGKPPKEVAKNFFSKVLGTVGDILGVGINVICDAGRTVISIADTVCNGIISLIQSIANGIVRIVTLNKTCIA